MHRQPLVRALAVGALIASATALLSGCVVINIPTGPAASPSASLGTPRPTAPPTPTPTATAMPGFDTIDGTWCSADRPSVCLTIEFPSVFEDDEEVASVADPYDNEDSAPCYSSYLADVDTGEGEVGLFYCPAGFAVAAGVEGDHDDVAFDRLYLTQSLPYVDVYFRAEELDRALG